MSSNGDDDGQGGAGRREVAWRVFAAEYDDADFDYSESDEERAPNYVVTPTGARVNRLFVAGVLTEIEQVSDDVLRGRVVDPTGAFVLYAGQYQPDEMAFLERADPPTFVAVTGKARTFQPDDSDRVFTSIRPESISEVDAETRDRWTVQTAEQTLARVSTFADALDSGERGDDLRAALEAGGADAGLAAGVPLALDHYGTTPGYLAAVRDLAVDATRVVAGEIDASDVGALDLAPDEGGDAVDASLDYSPTDVEVDGTAAASEESSEMAASDDLGDAPTGTVDDAESASESDVEAEPDAEAGDASEPESAPDLGDAPETEVEAGGASDTDAEAASASDAEEPPEVEDAEDAAELQDEVGTDEPPEVEPEQDGTTDEEFAPETGGDEDEPDLGTAGAGDEMYEFDEEEREQVEEEYGLEFSSGSEVDSPEESEMEPPSPDPEAGPDESTPERESELADESPNAGEHAEPTAEEVDADELQDVESAQGGTEEVVNADDQSPAGAETAAAEAPGASIGETAESEDGSGGTDEAGGDHASESETPDDLEDAVMDRMRELDEGDGVERETLLAAVVQRYDVTPADVEEAVESALMAGRCYEAGEDTLKPI